MKRCSTFSVGAGPSRRARSFFHEAMIRPYCTPEGQAVSQARHSRHRSRCRRTSGDSAARPSVTAR